MREDPRRATGRRMADREAGAQMRDVACRDIAPTVDGRPARMIETLARRQRTFMQMTEEMAPPEGEDETLEGWRRGHGRYDRRPGGFALAMPVIRKRFDVVGNVGAAHVL